MLASMVVAVTVTPALAYILLDRAAIEHRESPLVPWLKRHYETLLSRVIARPRATTAAVLVVVLAGVGVWPLLGHSLLPNFKERDFLMHFVRAEGTSRQETFRIVQRSSVELRKIPGVRNFGAHLGNAVGGDEPYGINFAENWISIDPEVDYNKTRAAIEEAIDGYPGMYRDVLTYLRERIKEVLSGSSDAIVVQIHGPELPVLRESAAKVYDALKDIPGLIDLHIGQQVNIPQIEVRVDLEKAAVHGLRPGDVRRVAAVVTSGQEVTDIHRDGKVYDVFVWAPKSRRHDVDNLKEFLIDTPYGGRVRLGDVAEVKIVPTPNAIKRENNSRHIDVEGNVKGRDLASVAEEVEDRLDALKFPVGYHPLVIGEYKALESAQATLLYTSIAAAIAIFILISVGLTSMLLGSIAMIPNLIPVLIFYGLLGLGLAPLSLPTSLIGCMALGIAIDDTVHFLVRYRAERRKGASPEDAALACSRFVGRPIAITSVMLFLGFMVVGVSEFASLQEFGVLSALTMGICLVTDLILLPAVLVRARV